MDDIFKKYIEEDYKLFSEKLIPGANILGIRSNNLRLIAKEYVNKEDDSLLTKDLIYHEEKMVYMYMLSYIKDINLIYEKLDKIVPLIDNWAVCDASMNIKRINKNRDFFYSLITKYKDSKNEFEARFVLIMLLSHYMDEAYLDVIFELLESVYADKYYTKMAKAWLLCECFIKYRDYTIKKLNNLKIDDFSFNKAIDKMRDSFRVSDEDKAYLKSIKRKYYD